jgi:glycosyltransferase involved in cell wall biosynthesis
VATAVDGTVEVLEHECSGLLVPPGESELLATAIIRLLEDSRLRTKFGQAARQAVIERFEQYQMLERTFGLYGPP